MLRLKVHVSVEHLFIRYVRVLLVTVRLGQTLVEIFVQAIFEAQAVSCNETLAME